MNAQSAMVLTGGNSRKYSAGTTLLSLALDLGTRFLAHFRKLEQVRNERRELMSLSSEQLRDIGLDSNDAVKEASRSYFDLPEERQ